MSCASDALTPVERIALCADLATLYEQQAQLAREISRYHENGKHNRRLSALIRENATVLRVTRRLMLANEAEARTCST